jgi:hypothetical protein
VLLPLLTAITDSMSVKEKGEIQKINDEVIFKTQPEDRLRIIKMGPNVLNFREEDWDPRKGFLNISGLRYLSVKIAEKNNDFFSK